LESLKKENKNLAAIILIVNFAQIEDRTTGSGLWRRFETELERP
jgi:hypothetical protein